MYTLFAVLLGTALALPAVHAVVTCITHNVLHRSSTTRDLLIALLILLFVALACR